MIWLVKRFLHSVLRLVTPYGALKLDTVWVVLATIDCLGCGYALRGIETHNGPPRVFLCECLEAGYALRGIETNRPDQVVHHHFRLGSAYALRGIEPFAALSKGVSAKLHSIGTIHSVGTTHTPYGEKDSKLHPDSMQKPSFESNGCAVMYLVVK